MTSGTPNEQNPNGARTLQQHNQIIEETSQSKWKGAQSATIPRVFESTTTVSDPRRLSPNAANIESKQTKLQNKDEDFDLTFSKTGQELSKWVQPND